MKGDGDIILSAGVEELGGCGDVPGEGRDSLEVVEWDPQLGFALMAHFHRGTVLSQVGSFQSSEERIEMAFHDFAI